MASPMKVRRDLPRLLLLTVAVWLLLEAVLAVMIRTMPTKADSVSHWSMFYGFSVTGTVLYVAAAAGVIVMWFLGRLVLIAVEIQKSTGDFEQLPPRVPAQEN